MRKLIFAFLAATIILTGCSGSKAPYADIIDKYIVSPGIATFPEEYYELGGAMMAQALRELETDGCDTEAMFFKWEYADPKTNLLGIGGITLSIKCDGVNKTYTYIFG